MCVTSSRLKMPKAAAGVSRILALCSVTNSFTSARVAVFNPPRGLVEVTDLFEQFFRFFVNKTSAVESSSHCPEPRPRAPIPRRGSFSCRPAASVVWKRKRRIYQNAAWIEVCWQTGRAGGNLLPEWRRPKFETFLMWEDGRGS